MIAPGAYVLVAESRPWVAADIIRLVSAVIGVVVNGYFGYLAAKGPRNVDSRTVNGVPATRSILSRWALWLSVSACWALSVLFCREISTTAPARVGRDGTADREPSQAETFRQAKDPAEHLGRDRALQQHADGDIEQHPTTASRACRATTADTGRQ